MTKIMSMYGCRNKCAFIFRRNASKDVSDVTSSGRLFQILGRAVANERSLTVARCDGRTSKRLVVDNQRRPLVPLKNIGCLLQCIYAQIGERSRYGLGEVDLGYVDPRNHVVDGGLMLVYSIRRREG